MLIAIYSNDGHFLGLINQSDLNKSGIEYQVLNKQRVIINDSIEGIYE